ncbi:MAG: NapC/NirT family cytochrome c, partial [Actinomycetota bacterium]
MTEPVEPNVPSQPAVPTEPTEVPVVAQAVVKLKKRHFRRTRTVFAPAGRLLSKIPHPPWRSKRGIFTIVVALGGFGLVTGVAGMTAISFSETPGFCGMCHTMDPELKAYAMSPHKDVTCAECHIGPGLGGFVKAKANGTKQLLHIITGQYPTPIEPPDHTALPPVKDTCLKCHSMEGLTANGGPVKLVLRPRYKSDETNTRETIAIMIRPAGLGQPSATTGNAADGEGGIKGVHWHVQQKVTYTSADEHAQKIDLVESTAEDGTVEQYIAGTQVSVSTDAKVDVDRLKASQTNRTMDCLDCHNRVGHAVPSPDRAIDQAIGNGLISTKLPFIKRDSVALLNADYPTLTAADTAIDGLRTKLAAKYPLVVKAQDKQVTQAIAELKVQYRLIATPAMKVQAKTYPDNLGHQTSPGCFRCHDGAHYLVVKGQITNKTIPSECSTCHTFPQIGANASAFPLGAKPDNHKDKLWVFSHKLATSSKTSTGTTCVACHKPTYCENCHNSGAIKVT